MKKEQWTILLAFLVGIVVANLLDKELLTTYGILNEYFLNQYSYQQIDGNRLFCHILIERGKAAFTIFLLGRAMDGKVFAVLVKSVMAALFGFLIVVAITNLGMRGVVVCVCGLLPQWIFYLAALLCYANGRRQERNTTWDERGCPMQMPEKVIKGLVMLVCMVAGVVTESYINPLLFQFLLKIF